MSHRPWHDRLDAEMKRRGVPAKYRRRFLAEASDHADDLTEGGAMSEATIDARMGEPDVVAATAADQYRRSTWTRRHPLLVFGLLPVPLVAAAMVGLPLVFELLITGVAWLCGDAELERAPRWLTLTLVFTSVWVMKFVPFMLAVWFFTRRFVRSGVRWGWHAAAMAQVLFLAGSFFSTLKYSDTPGESCWQLGFAWLLPFAHGWQALGAAFGWSQVFQLLVPAGLAWLLVALAKRRRLSPAV